MVSVKKVDLWKSLMQGSMVVEDYLKTPCIFTDWLRSIGEIQGDKSDALIVVDQLMVKTGAKEEDLDLGNAEFQSFLKETLGSPALPELTVAGNCYKMLCSSAGLLKKSCFYYVRKDIWEQAFNFCFAGLDPWNISSVPNKWLVYPGLLFSTAKPVDWQIDYSRIAVLPDVSTEVTAEVKRLVLTGNPSLEKAVISKGLNITDGLCFRFRDDVDVPLSCETGTQLADWVKKTPLKAYTIRQFFVKGLCVELPRTFLEEVLRRLGKTPEEEVTDLFGVRHRLSDLDLIMFDSVFKMGSAYRAQFGPGGMAVWRKHCEEFSSQFYVCVEQHKTRENYFTAQPFQTMLAAAGNTPALQALYQGRSILEDYNATKTLVRTWGNLGKACCLFPALAATGYCRQQAYDGYKNTLWGLLKARIPVGQESSYLFVATDPVAVIQGMVGAKPTGLLKANEISAPNVRKGEVLVVRHPHPNNNLVVAVNRHVLCPAMGLDVVWVSAHDLMAIVLKMDFDGDHLQVITNETLVNLAKETNRKVGQLPVIWASPKGAKTVCSESVISSFVLSQTQSSRVGLYSDSLTRMWNSYPAWRILKNEVTFAVGEYLVNEDIDSSKGGGNIQAVGDAWLATPMVKLAKEPSARAYKKQPKDPHGWYEAKNKQKAVQGVQGNLNAWMNLFKGAKKPNGYNAKKGTAIHPAGDPDSSAFWQLPEDYPESFTPATDGQFMFDHDLPVRRCIGLTGSQNGDDWERDKDGNIRMSEAGVPIPACQWGKWANQSAEDWAASETKTDNVSTRLSAQTQRLTQIKLEITAYVQAHYPADHELSLYEVASVVAMHLYFFAGCEQFPNHWFRFFWQVFGDEEVSIVRKNWGLLQQDAFPFWKDKPVALEAGDVSPEDLEKESFDDIPQEYEDVLYAQMEDGTFIMDD